jgi:hypothetical protein
MRYLKQFQCFPMKKTILIPADFIQKNKQLLQIESENSTFQGLWKKSDELGRMKKIRPKINGYFNK